MSIKVSSMVWEKWPSGGSEMLCMLALADWCNDEGGSLYPSMNTLARKMRVSESQARRVMHNLISRGFVRVVGNANGGAPGSTRQYHLNVAKVAALKEFESETGSASARGSMDAREGSHGCAETGSTHDTLTVIDPLEEPLVKPHVASDDATSGYSEDFEQCWKAYPKRHRPDNKKSTHKKWQARINEGVSADVLTKTATRYASECEQEGITSTRYVKLAATFFGPDEHWREYAGTAQIHRMDDHRGRIAQQDVEIKYAPSRGRPIPFGCEQPDDDGVLTLPDGTECHIEDWDAGNVTWGNQA
jgi:hypothetical protein